VFTRDGQRPIDPSDDSEQWKAALRMRAFPTFGVTPADTPAPPCSTSSESQTTSDPTHHRPRRQETTALYTHVADERTHAAMAQLGLVMDYR
jgi:hypothetical protein